MREEGFLIILNYSLQVSDLITKLFSIGFHWHLLQQRGRGWDTLGAHDCHEVNDDSLLDQAVLIVPEH